MLSPDQVYEDLEGDHRSREGEVRLIERFLQQSGSEDEKSMLKRALILLIYAHLEGFCKFALLAYVAAVNSAGLQCAEASYPIAAASLSRVFASLRNASSKHDTFRRSLPDDSQLHLAARERQFMEEYEVVIQRKIQIPDVLVDTKSNLSPVVLKKIMFQLGLEYPAIEEHESNISKLLGIRNAIAHGDRLKIPTDKQIEEYSNTAFIIMRHLQGEVYDSLKNRHYLRQA